MIPGPDLAAWLADTLAQDRSFARVDACASKWSVHPLMSDLEREVALMRVRTPEALLAAARRFLDRRDEIDLLVREMIAMSRIDPFFRPPFQPVTNDIQTGLLLYHHPDLSIALSVTGIDALAAKKAAGRGAGSINFTGYNVLMRFIDAGGATFSFWEAPEITDAFTAADAGRCRLVGRRRIADGEDLLVDGRRESFVIDHATRDIVYLQAVIRGGAAPVTAEYDAATLGFIGASSTDEAASRIQMMASLLRAMEREDALPLLEAALADAQFHTRWHLMREMLAMDATFALPPLRRMAASDPNPDVRAAAADVLARFFPGETPAGDAEAVPCRA
jgi:hypothetical protein